MTTEFGDTVGTIVDLFCGCGGFSLGAELAGFRSVAAIDIDPTLQSAYGRNFRTSNAFQADVTEIEASNWRHLIGSQRPDGVIGGPPCQGFSWIGKRQNDDTRNSLVHQFFRHVALLQPKFFIMENVEGLLHPDKVGVLNAALEAVPGRYTVLPPFVLNALDFGAATSRRRVVVIGYDPAEMSALSESDFRPCPPSKYTTVREAISDLPSPIAESADRKDFGWAKYPRTPEQQLPAYAQMMRRLPPSHIGHVEAIERNMAGMVSGVVRTRHSPEITRRYANIVGGKIDPITKSYKLEWDGQCPTLRAGTGAERGAFQAVRPLHPTKGRVITVREAARLQGFPDWFTFHPTKWHSFRMIGNSVSPLVSSGLLGRIASSLKLELAA
ncbi:MAG: DNA cytosine methyltransferase [Oceanicaulis sp.]|nr:DNA cytosine methyltransferase [Oceanicaulis sp.]